MVADHGIAIPSPFRVVSMVPRYNRAMSRLDLSVRRRWAFRIAAIAVGLLSLGAAELGLRIAGVDRFHEPAAPMVGFSTVRPLFERDASGDRFEIPKSRQVFFQPDSFPAEKSPEDFRVFCLGGSTVQGRPYSIETSFTRWLELNLRAADPSRNWEVINCGGVSYASYRLVPVLREIERYQPDLVIIYTGHNEFLEERSYAAIKRQPPWLRNAQDSILELRIAGILRSLLPSTNSAQKVDMSAEVQALLDYEGGMEKYHRDDAWRNGVIYEYEQNLRLMTQIAKQADIPLWFVNPVSNIRDTPPFKVELDDSWTKEQLVEFERRWQEAKACPWEDLELKARLVRAVLELDSQHAEAQFLLAKIYDAQGNYDDAKHAYLRAKDEDVCPLRMLEPMYDVLRRVSDRADCPLVDVRAQFEANADQGLPGDKQLIDHVHPRIKGHQLIAQMLFDELSKRGYVNTASGWKDRREQLYRENYASLPDNYFPESVERLRGLKIWAAGRATRLQLSDRDSK